MTIATLNIVKLIEKSAITRLSQEYENKLLNKIKSNFTDTQQQIFVSSFYTYLSYDTKKDFVIDFDSTWKWLGFSRKDPAKRMLEKHFVIDVNYKIQKAAPQVGGAAFSEKENNINLGGSGLNKENILLSVNTFKKFCLKAGTKKADEVHEYYIKLEELFHETVNEETNELRLQLQEKNHELHLTNNTLEQTTIMLKETQKEVQTITKKYIKPKKEVFEGKNVVYFMCTDESEKLGEYAVGKAVDLSNRKEDYNHNKLHEFKVSYYVSCKNTKFMDVIEGLVLSKLSKYKCKSNRDVFQLPESTDFTFFKNILDDSVKVYNDVDKVTYPKRTGEKLSKEEESARHNKYYTEHKKEIKEKNHTYYEENKEQLSYIKKLHDEKNEDTISKKYKKYYEDHKEAIIEQVMDYYEEHKEDILNARKDFYQDNKDVILEERSKHYKENYTTKIAVQRQKKERCECGMTVTHYCIKNHKKTQRHADLMKKLQNFAKNEDESKKAKCECGMTITIKSMKKHKKTNRHTELLKKIEDDEYKDDKYDEDEDKVEEDELEVELEDELEVELEDELEVELEDELDDELEDDVL